MARLLVAYRIHAVVVIDEDERAAGVISQTDVVLARQGRSAEELGQLRADEIMTPSLIHCEADTRVSEAVTTMTRRGIHRLIVTEERDGRPFPIGVVSMTDIIHKMVATPAGGGDGRIAG